jgi:SAM-dependent methyltransferase
MSTPTHWDNISRIGNTHFTTARGAERNWNRYYFATYTRVVRSMLEGESRGTAFDCGTSYGDWLRFLRDAGFQRVLGAEIDPGRAAEAQRRGYDDVFVGDAANADAPDGSVDVVLSNDVFVHILRLDDKAAVLANMFRLLRPGGCMIVNHASVRAYRDSPDYLVEGYCSFISLDEFSRLIHERTAFAIEDVRATYRHWRLAPAPRLASARSLLMATPAGPPFAHAMDRWLCPDADGIERSDAFYLKLRKPAL